MKEPADITESRQAAAVSQENMDKRRSRRNIVALNRPVWCNIIDPVNQIQS